MPWYDYQCEKCGYVFEVQRAMSDTSSVACKSCQSTRTVKIFAPAGIQFKGSGFYVTDSRNGSTNGAAAPADSSTKDSDSASDIQEQVAEVKKSKSTRTTGPAAKPSKSKPKTKAGKAAKKG